MWGDAWDACNSLFRAERKRQIALLEKIRREQDPPNRDGPGCSNSSAAKLRWSSSPTNRLEVSTVEMAARHGHDLVNDIDSYILSLEILIALSLSFSNGFPPVEVLFL